MLSTAAWNAFLKTLEEPPPNTVFVLATTEAQKVPATVVDRCHRFDFHRPTVEQIASVVRRTAQAESIEIPPEAVAALARSATGSFRDALGTLEQLRHLQRSRDRAGGRARGARAWPTRRCWTRPSTRSPPATPARALRGARASAPSRAATRARSPSDLEVQRARAAGRADARRGARRAVADARGRRAPARAGRARGPRDGRAPARAARRGDGGRARGRGPAHAPGAGAGEGGAARGGRLDAGAARPHRAPGARRGAVAAPGDSRRNRARRLRPMPRRRRPRL